MHVQGKLPGGYVLPQGFERSLVDHESALFVAPLEVPYLRAGLRLGRFFRGSLGGLRFGKGHFLERLEHRAGIREAIQRVLGHHLADYQGEALGDPGTGLVLGGCRSIA